LICSDLDSVPLSFAVAASSSVPVLLSAMTVRNYAGSCTRPAGDGDAAVDHGNLSDRLLRMIESSYRDAAQRPYLHLVDGGLVDNLGVRGLLDHTIARGSLRRSFAHLPPGSVRRIVLVSVNSERDLGDRLDDSDRVPSTGQVLEALVFGAGLTIFVVYAFLNSWRSTLITALSLPTSAIAAFIAVWLCGFTLNFMTLLGLSLAIGVLIDDAIVVRENIVRHVQMGKSAHDAALDGTDEIGLAVLATTLSIVAVFLPIGFMGGIVGKFFHEFGITIVAAVLISMFVSFTLDPMLSSVWHDPQAHGVHRGPPVTLYDRTIGRVTLQFDRFTELAVRRLPAPARLVVLMRAALAAALLLLSGCALAPPGTCSSDAQCGSGRSCKNGVCVGCNQDAECRAWESCSVATRTCTLASGRCSAAADCLSWQTCDATNTCALAAGSCVDASGCQEYEECSSHRCVLAAGRCRSDADCSGFWPGCSQAHRCENRPPGAASAGRISDPPLQLEARGAAVGVEVRRDHPEDASGHQGGAADREQRVRREVVGLHAVVPAPVGGREGVLLVRGGEVVREPLVEVADAGAERHERDAEDRCPLRRGELPRPRGSPRRLHREGPAGGLRLPHSHNGFRGQARGRGPGRGRGRATP